MPGRQRPASGPIVSPFGPRKAPLPGASTYHLGVDIIGDGNVAPEDGYILSQRYAGAAGYQLTMRGDSGTVHVMMHHRANSWRFTLGARVLRGQRVGDMGSTGNVTGKHVHWETHPNGGAATDPLAWLAAPAGGGAVPINPSTPKDDDMIHFLAINGSGNGAIAQGQRFVQGADGPLRCLSDGEWGPIALSNPPVAEWPGDSIVGLAQKVGLREYEYNPKIPGGVGRLTGKVIYVFGSPVWPMVETVNPAATVGITPGTPNAPADLAPILDAIGKLPAATVAALKAAL